MDDNVKIDLISDLPQSIIEAVLTRLPIRDAVRTSILSSKWRSKWSSITHLEFTDKCVLSCYAHLLFESKLVNFITRCLFLHDGPIHKFTLSTSFLQSCDDIYQWLRHVSRRDIKELSIELAEGEWFKAPSCLFNCVRLTQLELVRCELDPPPTFKGFLFLKFLNLQQVLISPDDIESLISSCPLLEGLMLSYFDGLELTIRAPNLKCLSLEGEFRDIHLENTPRLDAVCVAMYMTDDILEHFEHSSSCNFDKFFGGVPYLQRLVGQIYFTKYLSVGYDKGTKPITYNHLRSIELYQVNFEDLNEVLVVFRLLVNSPNLRELQISGSSNPSAADAACDEELWETECGYNCDLIQLKTVKMTEISGLPHEMWFIRFLLQHSPFLEVLTITPSSYVTDAKFSMLIHLARFRRASRLAEVVFVQDEL